MLANSRFRLFLKSMFILIDYFISCNHQVKPKLNNNHMYPLSPNHSVFKKIEDGYGF